MVIVLWICWGIAGLLLAASGICWALFVLLDDSAWRRLGVKVFRFSMVFVLFSINMYIYSHIVKGLG
jgi:hypothetical protein